MMKRKKRILLLHGFFAILLLWMAFFWKCPSKILLGIPCPGCGLTRACKAALRFRFREAFSYHPLFPIAVPVLLYMIHYRILPYRLPRWAEWTIGVLIIIAFFGLYGYRMLYDPVFRSEGRNSFVDFMLFYQ